MGKLRVLFVCVENSCRSQMAEGFARKEGAGVWEVWSAGSRPSGKINERAIQFMGEKGIDLHLQWCKGLEDLPLGRWKAVITMGCGETCPRLPAEKREDWDLPDPKNLSDDEFRAVRDQIEKNVLDLRARLS